jgi:hypothetical protein
MLWSEHCVHRFVILFNLFFLYYPRGLVYHLVLILLVYICSNISFICSFLLAKLRERGRTLERGFSVLRSGFMSAEFDLALVGVQLKLWILSLIAKTFVVASCCCLLCYMLLCCLQQRLNLVYSAISMPLRPKRYVFFPFLLTCDMFFWDLWMFLVSFWNGFVGFSRFCRTCSFGAFFYLFLFLRGALTW